MTEEIYETDLQIGPAIIESYSRLNYTMWHALAEFIDNSTQSRTNYGGIIDDVLKAENSPLVVNIVHNRTARTISIEDNSIGMTKADLIEALRIATPTRDSKGRSKYGLGLKTAACWIGRHWQVITTEWDSGQEWTATVDVPRVANRSARVPLTLKGVEKSNHYTKVVISNLHRTIQIRTEETIKAYLGSMYRFDIADGKLSLLYNGEEIKAPDAYDFDTDPLGTPLRRDIPPTKINGKTVSGWFGVLRKGGRKYGGFSLFKSQRQIQGFPNAWKPKSIYGGEDDEGANNLVAQRLIGLLELDDFVVSHTKDTILFEADEEEQLEDFLKQQVKEFRDYANKRRGPRGTPWKREKVKDLLQSIRKEFTSTEMSDAVSHAVLPPLDLINRNNEEQRDTLEPEEQISEIAVTPDLKVIVSLRDKSAFEPYLSIVPGASPGVVHVIINNLHPYYTSLETGEAIEECIRQYIYDAIAQYKASKLTSHVAPATVVRLKDDLLKAQVVRLENAADLAANGSAEMTAGPTS